MFTTVMMNSFTTAAETIENIAGMFKEAVQAAGKFTSGDFKILSNTLKEMKTASVMFNPYRDVRKITVFGSARTRPGTPSYELAKAFGKRSADAGFMVISGGGPGIMQAVTEGAGAENSFGACIQLPFEAKPNPILSGGKTVEYKYFFNRKVAMVKEAGAIVAFPGGIGTIDEISEILTLMQTGKTDLLPVILVDQPGGTYWERFRSFLTDEMLENGYVSKSDFSLFQIAYSAEEAVTAIGQFYARYGGMTFRGGKTSIKMSSRITEAATQMLKFRYRDILTAGGDLEQKGCELVIDFNRKDYSRLRELIDDLNAAY